MSTYPVGERAVLSPADAVTKRAAIRAIIEGATPLGKFGAVTTDPQGNTSQGDPLAYFNISTLPNLTRWYCQFWPVVPTGQVIARIHANQWTGNNKLLIYQAGHFQRFFVGPDANPRAFVRRMRELGCDVLLVSMPLMGENQDFMPSIGKSASDTSGHVYLWSDPGLAPSTGTPMRYYLDATVGAIDWMIAQHGPYEKIITAGLSGGGEMTTLLAAIDPRITHSYAVSGSVPFGSRSPGHDGEQLQGIDMLGVDFPDLYLMGTVDAAGAVNRKARLLYTSDDSIFNRHEHAHVWATKDFARANGFGSEMLKVRIDYGNVHDISAAMADWIVTDTAT